MTVRERLERLATVAASRHPKAGTTPSVSRSAASFKATDDFHKRFGDDAVIILIREDLPNLVQTKDLAILSHLEACLAGQVLVPSIELQSFAPAPPGSLAPYGGRGSPCGK